MNCSELLSRWRSWIRPLVFALYTAILLIALPLMVIEFQQSGIKLHLQAWFVAGLFVLMSLPISFWGILQHLIHFTQPGLQRYIIRILWMVPIYAGDAWFALRFKEIAIYLDTLRECYEAYVIYNFMAYLLAYLRMQYPMLEEHLRMKPEVKHIFPFCCLPVWPMGKCMVERCRHGVLQYVVIRPVMTAVALITQLCGVYKEGDFDPRSAWLYVTLVNNVSQVWAMYCLVEFYRATKEELAPLKPVAKFMCVKAVVFMSFWQQFVIAILVAVGVIKASEDGFMPFTAADVATGLQDFCICLEMLLAAVAHYFSFSHKDYVDPMAEQVNCCSSFLAMWDVSDVREDVYHHVRHVGSTVVRPLRPKTRRGENERTPLLTDDDNGYSDSLGPPSGLSGRASVSTFDSLTESYANQSDFDDRRSLTASMTNYVEFNDSEQLNTDMGEAIKNARLNAACNSPVEVRQDGTLVAPPLTASLVEPLVDTSIPDVPPEKLEEGSQQLPSGEQTAESQYIPPKEESIYVPSDTSNTSTGGASNTAETTSRLLHDRVSTGDTREKVPEGSKSEAGAVIASEDTEGHGPPADQQGATLESQNVLGTDVPGDTQDPVC